MTRLQLLLAALLCACSGQVTTYQAEPASSSQGGGGAQAAPVGTGGAVTVTGEVAEPDCEGDAMCWPWGFCDAGWCQWVDGGVD